MVSNLPSHTTLSLLAITRRNDEDTEEVEHVEVQQRPRPTHPTKVAD
jgi:hypothetical protein